MKLYIAEKKDVAAAISEALQGQFKDGVFVLQNGDKITWLYGHLLRLADPEEMDERFQKWHLQDLPMRWEIQLKPLERHQQHLDKVLKLLEEASEIVHAGDPDPEGQRLVDEVLEYAQNKKKVWRILINDNNAAAIKKAVAAMEDNAKFQGLSQSALARAVGDQRYGYNLTRVYTLLAQRLGFEGVLSVGRVQTPILGLIVRRDRLIAAHQSAYFYHVDAKIKLREFSIQARYQVQDSDPVDEQKRLVDAHFSEALCNSIQEQTANVISAEHRIEKQAAPLPFNLLALQAAAAEKFHYSPKEVLDITQALRDAHRAITYNRSDCRYLNDERHEEAPALLKALEKRFSSASQADSRLKSRAFNHEKVTAHHAIIPTENVPSLKDLSEAENHIYELICLQYIAQFFPMRELAKSKLSFDVAGAIFTASSSRELKAGWKALLGASLEEVEGLESNENWDEIQENEKGQIESASAKKQQTKPPKKYTMATLLKDLASVAKYVQNPKIKALLLDKDADKADEKGGIGTPATRDAHIETLFSRGYIVEERRNIVSTELGQQLIEALPEFASTPDLTALWHEKQKEIEAGTLAKDALLMEVDAEIAAEIERVQREGLSIKLDLPACPQCSGNLRLKSGSKGKFWGCTHYPDCKASFPDKNNQPDFSVKTKYRESSEFSCNKCGKPLIRRPSKKDPKKFWWGCSGFPQCDFTAFDHDGKPK